MAFYKYLHRNFYKYVEYTASINQTGVIIMAQQRQTSVIPKAPCGRILMAAGAKRVSQNAMDAFSDVIHGIADGIAKKALEISKHTGRKTIHEGDIKLAAKQ